VGDGVPDAVAPPPGHPRFPLFDSLRALAALSVLLVHAALFSGATQHAWYRAVVAHLDIGVTVFFLLSGFLLYRPFVAARVLGARSTRIRDYARRRFLRIAPAYWLALTALAIVPGLYGVFTSNWWVYYGLLQNYPIYTRTADCWSDLFRCGIGPTWSLAVEVAFYALLPFFALTMAWLTSRLRATRWLSAELSALALVAAISVAIQSYNGYGGLYSWLFFSPLGRGWWFGLGMGLAVISVWAQEREKEPAAMRWLGRHSAAPWAAALSLYLIACILILDPGPSLAGPVVGRVQYVGEYLLFGVIAALLLLPAIFGDGRSGVARRVLRHPVLAWLGLVSYGIFLWHFPILFGLLDIGVLDWWPQMAFPVLALTTLAITLVCASLSYYLVERPLMRLKYRGRRTVETGVHTS
jgi:peptidoglycan/LPS O-acetylase OafA/YrhL